jgi:hypothetical protein
MRNRSSPVIIKMSSFMLNIFVGFALQRCELGI